MAGLIVINLAVLVYAIGVEVRWAIRKRHFKKRNKRIVEERRAKREEEKLKKMKQLEYKQQQKPKLEIVIEDEEEEGSDSDSDSGSGSSESVSASEYDSKSECLETAKAANEGEIRKLNVPNDFMRRQISPDYLSNITADQINTFQEEQKHHTLFSTIVDGRSIKLIIEEEPTKSC